MEEGNYYYYCDNNNNPSSSSVPVPLLNEDDCLIQILLWLPVISLLRFKSVCKSWRAIIQNPFFIHTHATTTTNTNNKPLVHAPPGCCFFSSSSSSSTPLFLRYSYQLRTGDIFTVSGPPEFEVYDDLGIPGPEFEGLEEDYGAPPGPGRSRISHYNSIAMAGCCNGIICFHDRHVPGSCNELRSLLHVKDDPNCFIHRSISLWNPAIKQYRFLPIPFALPEKNHDGENLNYFIERGIDLNAHSVQHFVGFGFDVKTKDYKVLLITYDIYEERYYFYAREVVQVYSLSSDSWKCIDASHAQPNLIRCWGDKDQGHYLNGSYLFIAGYLYEGTNNSFEEGQQEGYNPVIMSFDFTKEIFRTIQLPFDYKWKTDDDDDDGNVKTAHVILFGGKIAVTNVYQERYIKTACLDIWVLNENNGGSESWSKFYTFVSNGRPKFITDNGEFILLDACEQVPKLQLLNVVTQEIKDLQYDEVPSDETSALITRVGVYKPSLIPVAPGNGATDNCLQVQVQV